MRAPKLYGCRKGRAGSVPAYHQQRACRRKQKGAQEVQDALFFDHHNPAGMEARNRALHAALDDMLLWLSRREWPYFNSAACACSGTRACVVSMAKASAALTMMSRMRGKAVGVLTLLTKTSPLLFFLRHCPTASIESLCIHVHQPPSMVIALSALLYPSAADSQIAIFDATNTTAERRQLLVSSLCVCVSLLLRLVRYETTSLCLVVCTV
jgi:hypothetical protein